AKFARADLTGADLSSANSSRAGFYDAVLLKSKFVEANLWGAKFPNADLADADFPAADLTRADVSGVRFNRSVFGETNLVGTQVCRAKGLEQVVHRGPSIMDVSTILSQETPLPDMFLCGVGIPPEAIRALNEVRRTQSHSTCFICYGEAAEEIGRKIREDLLQSGAPCWHYTFNKTKWGSRTREQIQKEKKVADKLVVLCSVGSLVRPQVLAEIEEKFRVFPEDVVAASLDDEWKDDSFPVEWKGTNLKPFLLSRVCADFENDSYKNALKHLLDGLRRP
ncbi:MAG: pentapeptide repeat-containing protein, partial [bacterium]